ncbi:MAG: hypothetical protein LBI70_01900 [Rickettsiales bacterium]|jgi:hypothetical protein|nr:hypothetical protein [Rickettsiales bacterium]
MTDTKIIDYDVDYRLFQSILRDLLELRIKEKQKEIKKEEKKEGEKKLEKIREYLSKKDIDTSAVDSFVEDYDIKNIVDKNPKLLLDFDCNIIIGNIELTADAKTLESNLDLEEMKERGINIIFVIGANEFGFSGGYHFVAARAFRDPTSGEIVVLYRDSFGGPPNPEFREYIQSQFSGNIRIIGIENQDGVLEQKNEGKTCGLRALTTVAHTGLFERIVGKILELRGTDNFIKANGSERMIEISMGSLQGTRVKKEGEDVPMSPTGLERWRKEKKSMLPKSKLTTETSVKSPPGAKPKGAATGKEETEALMFIEIQEGREKGKFSKLVVGNVVGKTETNFSIVNSYSKMENGFLKKQIENGGTHNILFKTSEEENSFVAAKIFIDKDTGRIKVLYADPRGGEINEKFEAFLEKELGAGKNIDIIKSDGLVGSNGSGRSKIGNLDVLEALKDDGLLDEMKSTLLRKEDKVLSNNIKGATNEIETKNSSNGLIVSQKIN